MNKTKLIILIKYINWKTIIATLPPIVMYYIWILNLHGTDEHFLQRKDEDKQTNPEKHCIFNCLWALAHEICIDTNLVYIMITKSTYEESL